MKTLAVTMVAASIFLSSCVSNYGQCFFSWQTEADEDGLVFYGELVYDCQVELEE